MSKVRTVYLQPLLQGVRVSFRRPSDQLPYTAVETTHEALAETLRLYSHPQLIGVIKGMDEREIARRLSEGSGTGKYHAPMWAQLLVAALLGALAYGGVLALDTWLSPYFPLEINNDRNS